MRSIRCLGLQRYTGDGHVLLSGAMVARDSVHGFSRAAPMTGLWLEESRFGDGFFDADGNDMYYVRDRLGNVTAVADGAATNSYYARGNITDIKFQRVTAFWKRIFPHSSN